MTTLHEMADAFARYTMFIARYLELPLNVQMSSLKIAEVVETKSGIKLINKVDNNGIVLEEMDAAESLAIYLGYYITHEFYCKNANGTLWEIVLKIEPADCDENGDCNYDCETCECRHFHCDRESRAETRLIELRWSKGDIHPTVRIME